MNFYQRPRRLLLDAQPGGTPPSDGGRSHNDYSRAANFDTNMVIILAALLCALICALGINSIVRCILRCATRISSDATDETPPRFGRKGLKKGALARFRWQYCPICLGEFLDGEKIRVLPKCHHCYHVKCVDIWLASHSSCPTCRQSLVEEQAESGGEMVVEVAGRQLGNASGGHSDAPATGSAEEVG
ncbi:hypothetical protein Pfo_015125 [Paulownia fortunei]|nr:hypothetical protein Pfo_015125 [Paulownia fortunei]